MVMSDGFWLGVLGGLLAELFSLSKLRYRPKNELPPWITSVWYWVITALLTVSGGVLVGIYLGSGVAMTPLLAVNIGASAPLILQSLVAQTSAIEPGTIN
jgi:mannitol-specific phosphotransferase system IIBC component